MAKPKIWYSDKENRNAKQVMKDRNEFISIFPKNSIGIEIGVQYGGHSNDLLRLAEPKKLYLVDPWIEQGENGDHNFNRVTKRFSKNKNIEIIRGFSVETAKKFSDNHFDWIYLDALHDYDSIRDDIEAWYPKLKKGGIFGGHDYVMTNKTGVSRNGVVQAVHEFMDKYKYELEYTTPINQKICPNACEWAVIKH